MVFENCLHHLASHHCVVSTQCVPCIEPSTSQQTFPPFNAVIALLLRSSVQYLVVEG